MWSWRDARPSDRGACTRATTKCPLRVPGNQGKAITTSRHNGCSLRICLRYSYPLREVLERTARYNSQEQHTRPHSTRSRNCMATLRGRIKRGNHNNSNPTRPRAYNSKILRTPFLHADQRTPRNPMEQACAVNKHLARELRLAMSLPCGELLQRRRRHVDFTNARPQIGPQRRPLTATALKKSAPSAPGQRKHRNATPWRHARAATFSQPPCTGWSWYPLPDAAMPETYPRLANHQWGTSCNRAGMADSPLFLYLFELSPFGQPAVRCRVGMKTARGSCCFRDFRWACCHGRCNFAFHCLGARRVARRTPTSQRTTYACSSTEILTHNEWYVACSPPAPRGAATRTRGSKRG